MKAIPTVYREIQMRSRLEAKWACMFDQLGWRWEYEPIDLAGWIPDFVISRERKRPMLVEVKPAFDKMPRDIQIKIEQALGAPKPAELRGPIPQGVQDCLNWEAFLKNLQYDVLCVGARIQRFDNPIDYDPYTGKFTFEPLLYIGWWMGPEVDYCWQHAYHLVDFITLLNAWTYATNAVQWKAPA